MRLALALALAIAAVAVALHLATSPDTDAVKAPASAPQDSTEREDASLASGEAAVSFHEEASAARSDATDPTVEVATTTTTDRATLDVTVLDEDRQPLEDVYVLITLPAVEHDDSTDTVRPDQGRSDAEGRCRIEVPPGRSLIVNVWFLSGIARMEPREIEPLAAGEERALTLEVQSKPDLAVTGKVIDAETSAPLPDIRVHVQAWQGIHRSREPMPLPIDGDPETTTDSAGEFTVQVHSWASGLGTFTGPGWSPTRARLEDRPEGIVVRMRRAGRLTGFVSSAKPGRLVVRAVLHGYELIQGPDAVLMGPGDHRFDAEVGPDGSFELIDLPSRVPMKLQVLLEDRVEFEEAGRTTLAPGETREVDWALGQGGVITGRVVNAGGPPRSDQDVWLVSVETAPGELLSAHHRPRATATTDSRGTFRFEDVAPGVWTVGLEPPTPARESEIAPMATQVEVPREGGQVHVDLTAFGGLYLEGHVLDPDGNEVEAYVLTFGGSNAISDHIRDAAAGFRLGPLVPGRYSVLASPAYDSGLAEAEPVEAEVTSTAGASGLVLKLRPGATISGTIRGADGAAVRARAHLAQPGDRLTTFYPDEGTFEFAGLTPGTHHLAAVTSDGRVGWIEGLVVEAGVARDDLEITVQEGTWVTLRNGREELLSYRVQRGEVVFAADGLNAGTEARVCVPVGDLDLVVDGQPQLLSTRADQEVIVDL